MLFGIVFSRSARKSYIRMFMSYYAHGQSTSRVVGDEPSACVVSVYVLLSKRLNALFPYSLSSVYLSRLLSGTHQSFSSGIFL